MTNKLWYLVAIITILIVWLGGVILLHKIQPEVDSGLITQISGICVLILTSLINMFGSNADGKNN